MIKRLYIAERLKRKQSPEAKLRRTLLDPERYDKMALPFTPVKKATSRWQDEDTREPVELSLGMTLQQIEEQSYIDSKIIAFENCLLNKNAKPNVNNLIELHKSIINIRLKELCLFLWYIQVNVAFFNCYNKYAISMRSAPPLRNFRSF